MTQNYDYWSERMKIRRFMSCKPTHPTVSGGTSSRKQIQSNTGHKRILFIIQFIFANLPSHIHITKLKPTNVQINRLTQALLLNLQQSFIMSVQGVRSVLK